MEWWDRLIVAVSQLQNGIVDYLFNQAGSSFKNLISDVILVDAWILLQNFVGIIEKSDVVFYAPVVQQIFAIMKAVSYSFIGLFFVIDICKRAAYFETTTIENVIKPVLMLVVGKMMVDYSMWILQTLGGINTSMVTAIVSLGGDLSSVMGYSNLNATLSGSSGIGLFFICVIFFIFCILMFIAIIGMYVVVVVRQIELGILICISPLFFSTLVADATNDVFKSFIKNFIVVCFQTTVMAIACVLFFSSIKDFISGTTGGIFSGFIETVVGVIGLTFFIFKSKSLLRESMGMGGGGGMSIASAVRAFF
jgi:hypothetical protein